VAGKNPFAGSEALAKAWAEGYLAGFAEPETDHTRPFAPDVLEAYEQGVQNGRDDRRQLPPERGGIDASGESSLSDLIETALELGLHAFAEFVIHDLFDAAGGLVSLVVQVVGIPTDTPIRPLEDDWEGAADQPEDTYIAVCPRDDHPPMLEGATSDGYWAGAARSTFGDALSDREAHGHAEAVVARCQVPEGTCGVVWAGKGT